jgi:hypothetical protein
MCHAPSYEAITAITHCDAVSVFTSFAFTYDFVAQLFKVGNSGRQSITAVVINALGRGYTAMVFKVP